MVTLKRNSTVRAAVVSIFEILFFCFFISWSLLAPPGGGEKAWAGQLLFDGVPVDITTAANNNLVIAPGSGGYTQIGVANTTNSHATTNNDLFITGSLETSSSAYLDSNVTLGSSTSNTITLMGYISSHAIPATTATYDLGSTSLYWRNAYIGTLYASTNAAVGTTSPATTSILDLTSTTKGFLAPRMTTVQRDAITTPATGLLIYNTTTNAFDYYTGAAWTEVTGGGGSGAAAYVTLAHDASLTADRILTGTANQITVTDNGAHTTVTLSTPQNIGTASTPQFAGVKTGYVYPAADGAAAFQVRKADGATNVLDVDTTNSRVGIGTAAPGWGLDVFSATNGSITLRGTGNTYATTSQLNVVGHRGTDTAPTTSLAGDVLGQIGFGYYKGGFKGQTAFMEGILNAAANGVDLALFTNTGDGTGTEQMRITSGGKVGIGTATPGSDLDITSTDTTTNASSITANSLTTGYGFSVSSTSTAADSYRLINLASSGAAAAGKNRYGLYSSLTGTGTGTNYGIYSTASGATTNYPGYFTGGPVLVTSGGTPANATGNGDLYVSGKLEVGGNIYGGATNLTGTTNATFTINSGGSQLILSSTGLTANRTITFPDTTTTLAGLGIAQTFTGANKINANSTTALLVEQTGTHNNTLTVDTTNGWIGINKTPTATLDISGNILVYSSSENQFYNSSGASSPYLYINPKVNGAVSYTRIGGWSASPASSATPLVFQPAGANIGIGPIFDSGPLTPSYIISIDGQSGHTIGQERDQTAATAGQDLTLTAGGANSGGTNLAGGNLYLKSGIATGSGYSTVIVQAVSAGQASGTTDRTPSTMATFGNTADLLLPAGTSTANTAPLKFTAGTNLTTAEAGAMEWDGTNLFISQTTGPTRKTIAYTDTALTGFSGTLGVNHGGTGVSSWTNGQLLIGNTTGNTAALATLTGTSNQVTVTNGASSITLSTPQDIATTSTPQFSKLGLGASATAAVDVQTGITAASGVANGVRFQQTLTAAANSDSLNGLYINPTYSDGAFTSVTHNGIAFPDAQATKINFGYNSSKAKWLGIDSGWNMAFADDTGFKFYNSTAVTSWGTLNVEITSAGDLKVYNGWIKPSGYINFESDNSVIGRYQTGTVNIGNTRAEDSGITVNLGRSGTVSGHDTVNLNITGTGGDVTYNFKTLSSSATANDDINIVPGGTGKLKSLIVYNTAVGATNKAVYVDSTGYIGYLSSSIRYKDNVKNMEDIGWLYALRPVNFTYKKDETKSKQYGLIAEEVEKVNPSFVSYGKDGKPESVAYNELIPVLVKSTQEQQKQIDQLKTEIDALKEQNELLKQTLSKIDLSSMKAKEGERL